MIQLLERKMIELTPDLAKHYLNYNNYPAQRNVRDGWINYLAECQREGTFRFGEVAFAVNGKDASKSDLMMNGQHVCHMVLKTGRDATCVLERYYTENEYDTSKLFTMFEIMGRSVADFVKAEQVALGVDDWPTWFASLIVAAASIEYCDLPSFTAAAMSGGKSNTWLTKDKRARLIRDYLPEGRFLEEILFVGKSKSRTPETKHLTRGSVVFVMFKTFRKSQSEAKSFWGRVRDGDNLSKNMPEKILREFLMQVQTRVTTLSARRITNHEFVYRAIVAWNNYRQGKTVAHLKYYPNKQPPKLK